MQTYFMAYGISLKIFKKIEMEPKTLGNKYVLNGSQISTTYKIMTEKNELGEFLTHVVSQLS